MRLALLTFYPGDPRVIPGGIRMVSYNLVQGLKAYPDLDLHVVHCHSDIEHDRLAEDGGATIHYLALPHKRVVPNLVTGVRRVQEVLAALKPDVVHAHVAHFAYAGARAGYPTIYTIHGVLAREREIYRRTLFDRLRYGLLGWYEARALRQVDRLVAISPYVLDEYAHVRADAWLRIDNPVPREFFAVEDRAEAGRILYAGSITEIKDLLTLLRAVERLTPLYPGVRLRLAGRATSAAYERQVRAYVETHGLTERVEFLGLLSREELLEEYSRCALLALSSVQENAPMAVIEAMAAGKPVVATRVGGVPDLVSEGETGYLVPAGDDRTMAERLAELLGNDALRIRLGQQARVVAQGRFGAERVAGAYYALYQRVLAGDDAVGAGEPQAPQPIRRAAGPKGAR
ncbi:MAG: glycosyltransferase family 4 protein [Chloroflexi bacterium]|nr:glycosyltransferase family 4 protein [Chloroflexota bacterium]